MNLFERKGEKRKKIICMAVCIVLVFLIVLTSSMQSFAVIPVIASDAVTAAFMVAMGFSATSGTMEAESLETIVPKAYAVMPDDVKGVIDGIRLRASLPQALRSNSFGLVDLNMDRIEYQTVRDWITSYFPDYYGTTPGWFENEYTGDYAINTDVDGFVDNTGQLGSAFYMDANVAGNKGVLYCLDPSVSNPFVYGMVGEDIKLGIGLDNGQIKVKVITTTNYAGDMLYYNSYFAGNYIFQSTSNTSTLNGQVASINTFTLYDVVGAIPVYYDPDTLDNNIIGDTLLGTVSSVSGFEYLIENGYHPLYNALVENVDGSVTIKIPVGEIDEDNKLPVLPPVITLDDVIAGYGSIQGYLDNGNSIVLGDGTVITGDGTFNPLRDLTRDSEAPVKGGTDEDVNGWLSELPLIGGILGAISGKISDILSWLKGFGANITSLFNMVISSLVDFADPFKWNKPNAPGWASGLFSFFSVLLALLIAIMALFGKIIIFLGQLYMIPASSAMLHPTMIQGLEWARGFNSQTGVNLYGLITGVISIVLGVVCFKLIRKIITGIGTAS